MSTNEIGPKKIPNRITPTRRFKMVDRTPPYNAGRSLSTFMKILLMSCPNFPVGVDIIASLFWRKRKKVNEEKRKRIVSIIREAYAVYTIEESSTFLHWTHCSISKIFLMTDVPCATCKLPFNWSIIKLLHGGATRLTICKRPITANQTYTSVVSCCVRSNSFWTTVKMRKDTLPEIVSSWRIIHLTRKHG